MNAMAVYILSGLLAHTLSLAGVRRPLYQVVFAPLASPINSSLLWALANVAVCWAVAWIMYRRGWFLRF